MKKKTAAIIISLFSIAIIALGVFTWTQYDRAEQYKRVVDASYQHAFGELVSSMKEIDSSLQKSLYATSPSMAGAICTEVFGKAMMAQMSLGMLPYSTVELEQTASFVSRVGDYAFSLSRSAGRGDVYDEEAKENLKALSGTASLLSQNLNALMIDMADGALTMDEVKESEKRMEAVEEDIDPSTLGGNIRLIEQEFPEVPSLIYDGPFSEHITDMVPKLLENEEEVTEDAARKVAAEFMGLKESQLTSGGRSEGKVPSYYFTANVEGGELSIEVSVQGAKVINVLSARQAKDARISNEDAVKIARRFLEKRGFESMKESYYMVQNNILTVNFAYSQSGVICYSDLVKVGVALDSGAVCGFEGMGYLSSHCERELPEPAVDEETARALVSPELKVLSHNMTVIPTGGRYELFCHEFKCESDDGRHYIIYVNAESGEQEKILILLEDESGALTL